MSGIRAHILIVEDEPAQRELLRYNLEAEGYRVREAADGDTALLLLAEEAPDLVLLDWMLPGVSGLEICRRIRAGSGRALPVIMLSARAEELDRVRGLDTGADDYLVKPFSLRELMARIRAQLRRSRPGAAGEDLRAGDIRLDPLRRKVTRAGAEIGLGPTEFRLLAAMLERPERVWSRDVLLDRVWGRDCDIGTRTVDVHIGRLRKALMRAGGDNPIQTHRGAGYSLRG